MWQNVVVLNVKDVLIFGLINTGILLFQNKYSTDEEYHPIFRNSVVYRYVNFVIISVTLFILYLRDLIFLCHSLQYNVLKKGDWQWMQDCYTDCVTLGQIVTSLYRMLECLANHQTLLQYILIGLYGHFPSIRCTALWEWKCMISTNHELCPSSFCPIKYYRPRQ